MVRAGRLKYRCAMAESKLHRCPVWRAETWRDDCGFV